jgi:hypothetical protein
MDVNKLLHEAHGVLTNFMTEEKVLGKHKALDERLASYMIRIGEEIKEAKARPPPKMSQNGWTGDVTIILVRDVNDIVYKFTYKDNYRVYKTTSPHWPAQYSIPANPDAEGYTWYMQKELRYDEVRVRIPLEPHEGPLVRNFLHDFRE